ncbi:MAG: STAS/SEC14 domain-containing protein [Ramlibacter sp.]
MTPPGDWMGFGKPNYEVAVASHARFTRITVTGQPTMEQMLSIVRVIGETSSHWESDAVLFDTRSLKTVFTPGEQFRLGEEAAACLGHMRKIAALVAPQVYTGMTEKAAQRSGANGRVFTVKEDALAWLHAADEGPGDGAAAGGTRSVAD